MKIALTGGAGIQAMSAMIYLLDQKDVTEIFVSDAYNVDLVRERVARLNDKRLSVAALDCTNVTAATKAFSGYDIVINSAMVRGRFIDTTRAALAAGAHYLDMTSLGEEPLQFAMHEQFERAGLTCILDMGTAPGLSNLMAVYCMEKLDQTDSIDYAWGVIDTVPPEEHTRPLNWGYGFDGIMGLMSGPSILYEDGEIKRLPPRARPEVFQFKSGAQQIKGMPHREPIMLAESFPKAGFKHVMYRQAFDEESERKYAFLRDLGFASREPIDVNGGKGRSFRRPVGTAAEIAGGAEDARELRERGQLHCTWLERRAVARGAPDDPHRSGERDAPSLHIERRCGLVSHRHLRRCGRRDDRTGARCEARRVSSGDVRTGRSIHNGTGPSRHGS